MTVWRPSGFQHKPNNENIIEGKRYNNRKDDEKKQADTGVLKYPRYYPRCIDGGRAIKRGSHGGIQISMLLSSAAGIQ